ncbi:MAG: hypothetical protein R3Y23_04760 [Bacillota bacterium]
MIKDLVEKIVATEAEADAMIATALSDAREMNSNAEAEADSIINGAKSKMKADRIAVQKQAEADAEAKYEEILGIGKNEAGKMVNSINPTSAVEEIITAFKERYVSR